MFVSLLYTGDRYLIYFIV